MSPTEGESKGRPKGAGQPMHIQLPAPASDHTTASLYEDRKLHGGLPASIFELGPPVQGLAASSHAQTPPLLPSPLHLCKSISFHLSPGDLAKTTLPTPLPFMAMGSSSPGRRGLSAPESLRLCACVHVCLLCSQGQELDLTVGVVFKALSVYLFIFRRMTSGHQRNRVLDY